MTPEQNLTRRMDIAYRHAEWIYWWGTAMFCCALFVIFW